MVDRACQNLQSINQAINETEVLSRSTVFSAPVQKCHCFQREPAPRGSHPADLHVRGDRAGGDRVPAVRHAPARRGPGTLHGGRGRRGRSAAHRDGTPHGWRHSRRSAHAQSHGGAGPQDVTGRLLFYRILFLHFSFL